MAERYGGELTTALADEHVLGQHDAVSGFGVPVTLGLRRDRVPAFDLLRLPRPKSAAPWAYVKIAEGCDRKCGFCAIPTFRGPQRSREIDDILREVDDLQAREIVLVAQDLASFGRDQGVGERRIVSLVRAVAARTDRVRLLYLYPSDLTDELIETVLDTDVPYFDLSLQHVSPPLLRRMRRWGDGERFLDRIESIRRAEPAAAFRSNFIVGYPGETEADHDALLQFVRDARLDWCGFFSYSEEEGTHAAGLDGKVPLKLVAERLAELRELQDAITAAKRDELIGTTVEVLVDAPEQGRSFREAPEIDGIVVLPAELEVGSITTVHVEQALGPDLVARSVEEDADADADAAELAEVASS
jgi:ribosomal protein S12 methylthiotransferase